MHLNLMLLAVGLAILVRLSGSKSALTWAERWQQALNRLLLPPVFLLITSLAVMGMGHHGTMLWQPVGWLGCHMALGYVAIAAGMLLGFLVQGWRSQQQLQTRQLTTVTDRSVRVLETSALFAAQVGFWQPELVVSQGLLQTLNPTQLDAVLHHEAAHEVYKDTSWFFWLNWLRWLTCWLPQTESLWQELLLLRELRADHWAAQRVDPLILAETLLIVARSQVEQPNGSAALYDANLNRLEERIEFLLSQPEIYTPRSLLWFWLPSLALPLLSICFHG